VTDTVMLLAQVFIACLLLWSCKEEYWLGNSLLRIRAWQSQSRRRKASALEVLNC